MIISKPTETPVKVSKICPTDNKYGSLYAIGTTRGWFEFRVTPTGFIKLFKVNKGKHYHFTPNSKD